MVTGLSTVPFPIDEPAILGGPPLFPEPRRFIRPVSAAAVAELGRVVTGAPLAPFFGGPAVRTLERDFARVVGVAHAVATTSGSTALQAALLATGLAAGDEVVLSPFTCPAPVAAVVTLGARPVFADIDPHSLALDPAAVAARLTPRTRAVVVAHMYGCPADVDALHAVTRRHGAVLLGDCCLAYGARFADGTPVGSREDLGFYSFQESKVVVAGQGGMVVTGSAVHAEALREVVAYGMCPQDGLVRLGLNCTMVEPIAVLARHSLLELGGAVAELRAVGQVVGDGLRGLPLEVSEPPTGVAVVRQGVPLILPAELSGLRDRLLAAMLAEHLPVSVPVVEPLYAFEFLRSQPESCPVAENLCRRLILLSPWPGYTLDEVRDMAGVIRRLFGRLRDLARLRPAPTAHRPPSATEISANARRATAVGGAA